MLHVSCPSDRYLHFIADHRYQNCVYTYRILPNEDKQLSVQVGRRFEASRRYFRLQVSLVILVFAKDEAWHTPGVQLCRWNVSRFCLG